MNGCRNLQHSRFPCAFSTFGVLEIKRGIAHMCGLLVFVKLWNASSEVLEEPCVPAGQLCGLRCLCGKNGVSLGIATAPKSTHCHIASCRRKLETRKYISVSYSLSNARQRPYLWLVCLRSESRKRKVSLSKLPIVFQGFGISGPATAGNIMSQNESNIVDFDGCSIESCNSHVALRFIINNSNESCEMTTEQQHAASVHLPILQPQLLPA